MKLSKLMLVRASWMAASMAGKMRWPFNSTSTRLPPTIAGPSNTPIARPKSGSPAGGSRVLFRILRGERARDGELAQLLDGVAEPRDHDIDAGVAQAGLELVRALRGPQGDHNLDLREAVLEPLAKLPGVGRGVGGNGRDAHDLARFR